MTLIVTPVDQLGKNQHVGFFHMQLLPAATAYCCHILTIKKVPLKTPGIYDKDTPGVCGVEQQCHFGLGQEGESRLKYCPQKVLYKKNIYVPNFLYHFKSEEAEDCIMYELSYALRINMYQLYAETPITIMC